MGEISFSPLPQAPIPLPQPSIYIPLTWHRRQAREWERERERELIQAFLSHCILICTSAILDSLFLLSIERFLVWQYSEEWLNESNHVKLFILLSAQDRIIKFSVWNDSKKVVSLYFKVCDLCKNHVDCLKRKKLSVIKHFGKSLCLNFLLICLNIWKKWTYLSSIVLPCKMASLPCMK